MKIPLKEKWLEQVIDNLTLLKEIFTNEEVSTMIYDGDNEDKITELQELIAYLNKTN